MQLLYVLIAIESLTMAHKTLNKAQQFAARGELTRTYMTTLRTASKFHIAFAPFK